jgi:hypothetical protein
MDIERFTRVFAVTPSRREIARVLSGLAVAGLLGAAARGETEAHKKHKMKKCKPCQKKEHGKCRGPKPDGATCKKTGKCFQGTCVPRPKCQSAGLEGGTCSTPGNDPTCCSGVCVAEDENVCQVGGEGNACLIASDCINPFSCIAYVCREA